MSRKSKIDQAEKVKVVERLLADEISILEAARLTGVGQTSIRQWRDLHLSRGAYYRWLKDPLSFSEKYNKEISEKIKGIHEAHPDMGYRRIRDELDKKHGIAVNDKRVLRICRKERIQSTIKWRPKSCTRSSNDPAHIAITSAQS